MNHDLALAKQLFDGSLDVICPDIKLLRAAHRDEVVARGCGAIRAEGGGALHCRMATVPGEPTRAGRFALRAPGSVIPDSEYVVLLATDEDGHTWKSNPFPEPSSALFGRGIRGKLKLPLASLSRSEPRPRNAQSRAGFVTRAPRLPLTHVTKTVRSSAETAISQSWRADHFRHAIGDINVEYRQSDDEWLTVVADRSSALMPWWPGVLCRALAFASARTVQPAVVLRSFDDRDDLMICSGPFDTQRTPMPCPWSEGDSESAWRMVAAFADHFDSAFNRRDHYSDLVFDELEGIHRGAYGSFPTARLTLSVGVEALARVLLEDVAVNRPNATAVTALVEHVKKWPGDTQLIERAVGAMSRFSDVSAVDRLHAWTNSQSIPGELLKSWKALRHTSAHGEPADIDQRNFDHYRRVTELLYRMVLWKIGYTGQMWQVERAPAAPKHP